jgi:hypothetical protein
MSQDSAFDDASIPVLTEVVRETPAPAPAAPAQVPDAAPEPVVSGQPDEHEWDALGQRLCEQITARLQAPIDALLQQRLREGMADVLQHVMAGLTDEIRASLAPAIEQIVREAVAQELGAREPERR